MIATPAVGLQEFGGVLTAVPDNYLSHGNEYRCYGVFGPRVAGMGIGEIELLLSESQTVLPSILQLLSLPH